MDREIVLGVLVLALCGAALVGPGLLVFPEVRKRDHRPSERLLWRRLWYHLLPASLLLSGLIGWSLQEPDDSDETVTAPLLLLAGSFGLVCARSAWRASRSLAASIEGIPATTVGIVRPRVVIAPELVGLLQPEELHAVREHEKAHQRHRDPLRVWLAQLATDLQWPSPRARCRLRRWKHALELDRDMETLARGVNGVDLAAALVAAARLPRAPSVPLQVGLLEDEESLKARVHCLLDPGFSSTIEGSPSRYVLPLITAGVIVAGVLAGVYLGEALLRAIPGVGS